MKPWSLNEPTSEKTNKLLMKLSKRMAGCVGSQARVAVCGTPRVYAAVHYPYKYNLISVRSKKR